MSGLRTSVGQPMLSAAKSTGAAGRKAVQQIGSAGVRVGAAASAAAAKAKQVATPAAKFVSGYNESQVGAVPRAVARAAISPRYPLLDRPGNESILQTMRTLRSPAAAGTRVFDRTRQLAAHGLRAGNTTASLGTAGAAIHGGLYAVPSDITQAVGAGTSRKPTPDQIRSVTGVNAPRFYLNALQHAVFPANDPLSQLVARHYRTAGLAGFRNMVDRSRKDYPGLMGAVDVMRSVTPFGALTTGAVNAIRSDQPPDYGTMISDAVQTLPQLTAPENQQGIQNSPVRRYWEGVLGSSPERVGSAVPALATQKALTNNDAFMNWFRSPEGTAARSEAENRLKLKERTPYNPAVSAAPTLSDKMDNLVTTGSLGFYRPPAPYVTNRKMRPSVTSSLLRGRLVEDYPELGAAAAYFR